METNNFTNFTKKYYCEYCDISCSRNTEWVRHLATSKHKKMSLGNLKENNFTTEKEYTCDCNKTFKTHSGLWKHKQKCDIVYEEENNIINKPLTTDSSEIIHLTNLVIKLMNSNDEIHKQYSDLHKQNNDLQKQNSDLHKKTIELQEQMLEVCKNSNTTINNNNNSKTFNMQVFLNEQCKDAMNIMDFVNSMTLEFSDLESVGKLGYVEGISGIIIKKLNEMDIYKRPIHCSDAKREIMFVKDDNVWEKENSTYDKLRKAIKYVTKKNSDMLIPWSKKYPACMNTSHPLNDTYIKLMGQAMGGKEEFVDSENKIMKKIAKAVLINKTC